jgi:serine/threonine-protein kinase
MTMSTPSVHRTSTKSHLTDDGLVAELRSALAGQFTIERVLGRGGMGVVYLGRELRLDRPVALKVLPPDLANEPAVRERFLREARTAALLSHPNIVPIYRVDEIGDLVFFVMGFVGGPTLGARIRAAGALPAPEAAKILREVAWALAYAHAHGVVHCDVKPDNILLDEATGRALVTDFGIAQDARGRSPGAPTPIVGSAHFMSPEQVTGKPLDARSDIYSLGVVGWYAVAGQLPFDGRVSDVLRKQVHEPPPALAEVAPEVSPALAEALERALAKSPDDRFPTAEAFADAIELSVAPPLVASVPVQVWLSGGDDLRYVLAAAIGATGLAMSHRGPWTEMATYAIAVLLALVLLELSDVRRLVAAGYDLSALRSALRAELSGMNSAGARRRSSSHAALRADRESMLRGAGLIVIGLALAAMGVVALINGTFSEHALGVVIAGAGILALSRGHAVGHDWVTTARARLWCSRMGVWLARVAAWRMPAPRQSALDVALQFMSARSPLTTESARRPGPDREGMSEGLEALQSIISELGEMASALRVQMQEPTRSLDGAQAPPQNAVALDRIRQRLASLQAEVSATAAERDRSRT